MSKTTKPLWEPIARDGLASSRLLAQIRVALEITPEDLEADLVELPGLVGRFGELFAAATGDYLAARHEREKLFARHFNDPNFALSLAEQLGKKPSLEQLKAEIELLPEYDDARRLETTAQARRILLDKAVTALEKKADMLQMIGAQRRAEYQYTRERTVKGETSWPE